MGRMLGNDGSSQVSQSAEPVLSPASEAASFSTKSRAPGPFGMHLPSLCIGISDCQPFPLHLLRPSTHVGRGAQASMGFPLKYECVSTAGIC